MLSAADKKQQLIYFITHFSDTHLIGHTDTVVTHAAVGSTRWAEKLACEAILELNHLPLYHNLFGTRRLTVISWCSSHPFIDKVTSNMKGYITLLPLQHSRSACHKSNGRVLCIYNVRIQHNRNNEAKCRNASYAITLRDEAFNFHHKTSQISSSSDYITFIT